MRISALDVRASSASSPLSIEPLESRFMMHGDHLEFWPDHEATLVGGTSDGLPERSIESHDARRYNLVHQPGDANRDGHFDQQDLIQVSASGRFLSGAAAVWEDGDWNHDGFFDVSDLVAALQNGQYMVESSSVYRLHSNPVATKVIYLDFDGHDTADTTYNRRFSDGQPFSTPAFDRDGELFRLSEDEEEAIANIWERVSEDFMPFQVDVTTEDPGIDALRRGTAGDQKWGVRVVIGGHADDWLKKAHTGFAKINSFRATSDIPAFVFASDISSKKAIAEVISHEVGHTLGLRHDGYDDQEYYSGHKSGRIGWAPIMGVGLVPELTQWSKGEYLMANCTQDDLAVITRQNGFGYRTDDHADSRDQATDLATSSIAVTESGIIEKNTDVDFFTFTASGGVVRVNVDPAPNGPNLDILAQLFDSAGRLILPSNQADTLHASFVLNLEPGRYFVSIEGAGKPTSYEDSAFGPIPRQGYSDFGSLGSYTISVGLRGQLTIQPPGY